MSLASRHRHIHLHPFQRACYLADKSIGPVMSVPPPPSPPSLLNQLLGGIGSFILSQIPAGSVVTDIYPLSLYQPGIYHSIEWFLLIPVGLTLAILFVIAKWPWAFWLVLLSFLILGGCVAWIYVSFPVEDRVHMVNWVLSYCVIGLLGALLFRAYLYARLGI
jgi:hypothetical protein